MQSQCTPARYWVALLLLGCLFPSWLLASELSGQLAWHQRVGMGSLVSGVIERVEVKPGQAVRKGEVLLQLDTRGTQAALRGAKSELQHAQVLLDEAQLEDDRATELYDRTLLSEHERAQASIGLQSARTQLQSAKAHLTQVQLELERSELRAPFDGRVLAVHAAPGQVVVSQFESQVLVEIAQDQPMELVVQTDLTTAEQIAQAGNAMVLVAGQRLAVDAVEIGLEATAETPNGESLFSLRAQFERPEDVLLRAGQPAKLAW